MFKNKVFLSLLLLTVVLAQTVTEGDDSDKDADKIICRNVSYFTGKESDKEKLRPIIENQSGICVYLEKTCCTAKELISLKKWWQGTSKQKGIEKSRETQRFQQDEDIVIFTLSIINYAKDLQSMSLRILENEHISENSYCKTNAKVFQNFGIPRRRNYIEYFDSCSEFISKIHTSIICSACDPSLQQALDLTNKNVLFDKKTLITFNEKCSNLVDFNLKYLFPYLRLVEELVKCNVNSGRKRKSWKDLAQLPENNKQNDKPTSRGLQGGIGLDQGDASSDISLTINESNIKELLSFGTKPSIQLEGNLEFLISLYHRTKIFLEQKHEDGYEKTGLGNFKDQEKQNSKRILNKLIN